MRVGTELHGAKAVVISVEDSGPGIEPEKMSSVFDAFVTTKATGMGLGLALSQMIIERHDGQIVVVPSANHGAHFRITLPIKNDSPRRSRTGNGRGPSRFPYNIVRTRMPKFVAASTLADVHVMSALPPKADIAGSCPLCAISGHSSLSASYYFTS